MLEVRRGAARWYREGTICSARRADDTEARLRSEAELSRPRVCAGCGGTFTPRVSHQVACSPRCRQRLHRRRTAAA